MGKIKNAFKYLVGATVVGGMSAYFSMSKENRQKVKDFMSNMITKKSMNSDTDKEN